MSLVRSNVSVIQSDELQVGLKESEGGLDASEFRLKQARVRLAVAQVGLKMPHLRLKQSGGGLKVWEVESDEPGIQSAKRRFQSMGWRFRLSKPLVRSKAQASRTDRRATPLTTARRGCDQSLETRDSPLVGELATQV